MDRHDIVRLDTEIGPGQLKCRPRLTAENLADRRALEGFNDTIMKASG